MINKHQCINKIRGIWKTEKSKSNQQRKGKMQKSSSDFGLLFVHGFGGGYNYEMRIS